MDSFETKKARAEELSKASLDKPLTNEGYEELKRLVSELFEYDKTDSGKE